MPTSTQVSVGANSAQLFELGVIFGSLTVTLVRFAVPIFVAVIVYVSVSPTLTSSEPSSSALLGAGLSIPRLGVGTGTVSGSVTGSVWSLSAVPRLLI